MGNIGSSPIASAKLNKCNMSFVIFTMVVIGAIYAPMFTIGVLMFMVGMPFTGMFIILASLIKKYIDEIPTLPKDQDYE